jgi:hypothetical protein
VVHQTGLRGCNDDLLKRHNRVLTAYALTQSLVKEDQTNQAGQKIAEIDSKPGPSTAL